jgi:hypothetical protein
VPARDEEIEDMASVPREIQLEQAIRHLEGKCARLDLLIAAERGPRAQMAKRYMECEVWALRLLIAKAKGEF